MAPFRTRPPEGRPRGHFKRRIASVLTLALALAAAASCHLTRLERKLTPRDADFYWKVHIIMTSEERKIFLELPESDRAGFVEEFWKRRDPDPETPDNPFKAEYESRLERAGQLFGGEGRAGYLTDRGRIYLLFGPPMDRLTYPMDADGYCREVWYYGGFPVIFVDEHCEGRFLLTAINLEHLEKLNIAQRDFQKTIDQDTDFFDYGLRFVKGKAGGPGFGGTVVIEVPYAAIWFDVGEGALETSLDVRLEVRTAAGARVWEFGKAYRLALAEDELKAMKGRAYKIEVPLALDGEAAGRKAGRLALHAAVRNGAEGEDLKKVLDLR